jgi:glutamate mutase epsilon subunit
MGWVDVEGVQEVERVEVDLEAAKEKRAVFVDVSDESSGDIREGEETLFVNAAVMDVGYRPVNAPWVVDLQLPRADGGGT